MPFNHQCDLCKEKYERPFVKKRWSYGGAYICDDCLMIDKLDEELEKMKEKDLEDISLEEGDKLTEIISFKIYSTIARIWRTK